MALKCFLHSLNKSHSPIELFDGKLCILGRSRETQIKDKQCSRNQVELLPDFTKTQVRVTQLGANSSSAGGKELKRGIPINIQNKDIIETITGLYKYKIEFESSSTTNNSTETMPKKSQKPKEANVEKRKNAFEDFGYKPKKQNSDGSWIAIDGKEMFIYDDPNASASKKIACFDMDGTIITTKSGKVFAVNYDDWKIIFPEVKSKLKGLIENGYKLVIFSNQGGISSGKQTPEGIQKKFDNIRESLGVPMQMFLACGKQNFRKPSIGMWEYHADKYNDGVEINKKESFYVGDAAGRPEIPKKKKKDFSCSDRLFALNVGIDFHTTEEFFLDRPKEKFNLPEFQAKNISKDKSLFEPSDTKIPKFPLEVVVLVGFPGSGKSYLSKNTFEKKGYASVNRDTIGSWQKCCDKMKKYLEQNVSVVVDNTNPDIESRKRYIDAAKELNVPTRCFFFDVTFDHARHNNRFRELIGEDHAIVNTMVYNMYKSKYKEPTTTEGFDSVVKVNFIPEFKCDDHKIIYNMFPKFSVL